MMVQQTIKQLTVLDGWLSVVGNIYPDTKFLLNRYALYNEAEATFYNLLVQGKLTFFEQE
jgi:hypothetical protein